LKLDYNQNLVFLSVFVAVQAGYVGLSLAQRIPSAFALRRRMLIAGAALTLSVGIWSMHFIGMLAIRTSTVVDYLVLPTLISLLVCVLVTGVAIFMASLRSTKMIFGGALFMGFGIAAMHYVGMSALNSSARMHNDPAYVTASIVLAVLASALALWLAFVANRRFPIIFGAIVFGIAVSGMHYIAMAGMMLHFNAAQTLTEPFISSDTLAIIVSVVAFLISAIFMLTLIPKEFPAANGDPRWAALEALVPDPESQIDHDLLVAEDIRQNDIQINDASAATVPIERNGNQFQISVADIVSVHANAHYTYIFNGRDDFFCPMSISEVDERIGSAAFFRTHRSYIVNLHHIERIQKSGDAAVVDLNATLRRSVPVARARVARLRREWTEFKDTQPLPLP
jgi:NO-binding membrane sensor protein with MHYT domain